MGREFWLTRWAKKQIGFHQGSYNRALIEHWPALGVSERAAVLVPLCGKSLDMRWLEAAGHAVYGVDFSESAIAEYFAEGGETPQCDQGNYLLRFKGAGSTLYAGDFFDIAAVDVPRVKGVFDRGALAALPAVTRARYADHLQRVIPDGAHILLLTLEFDEEQVAGPPFSVMESEINELFTGRCRVAKLESALIGDLPKKFAAAGLPEVVQSVYHIVKEH